MQLTDWQSELVMEYDTLIESSQTIDDLEPLAVEIILSTQQWLKVRCWPTVKRVHEEMGVAEERMLIVDALNWIRSDYSKEQDPAECTQMFMRRLRKFSKDTRSRWVVVAGDCEESNVRKEMRPEYKSSRSDRPSEINRISKQVMNLCQQAQVPFIVHEGYEADDVAATLSTKCIARGHKSIICTNDCDYCQLVNRSCVLYARDKYMNVEKVQEKYGVAPNQMVDYLILKGKDDLTSVTGIGEKTAASLLRTHGDFMGIYDHRHSLTENQRTALEEFAPQYWSVRECHRLKRDLPIQIDWTASNCL